MTSSMATKLRTRRSLWKVFETRRELEYVYVEKAGVLYDLKMIVYTMICICYVLVDKE